MNHRILLVTLFALMFSAFDIHAQTAVPVFLKHQVKKGDTAASIASAYSISKEDFLLLNDFPETVKLQPGQEVLIRTLSKGETLTAYNNRATSSSYNIGSSEQAAPSGFLKHTVKPGETASSISSDFGLMEKDFLLLNDFPKNVELNAGQEVLLRPLKKGETSKSESASASIKTSSLTAAEVSLKKTESSYTSEKPIAKTAPAKSVEVGPNGAQYKVTDSPYHIVQPKQTFYRIALIYGLTVDELKALNNMAGTDISIGQKFKVM